MPGDVDEPGKGTAVTRRRRCAEARSGGARSSRSTTPSSRISPRRACSTRSARPCSGCSPYYRAAFTLYDPRETPSASSRCHGSGPRTISRSERRWPATTVIRAGSSTSSGLSCVTIWKPSGKSPRASAPGRRGPILLCGPLDCRRQSLGTLHIASENRNQYSDSDAELLRQVANQVALAVANMSVVRGDRRAQPEG